jgi:2-methylcitrate dehydratase PrpD
MTSSLLALVATARFEDLPKPVVETARLALLDWWGVTVAGAAEPVARVVRQVESEPEGGRCAILGTGLTARPLAAAFWNGTAAHALDFDDVHLDLPGHVTAPIFPGLLALGETRGKSGRDVLLAFALGVEVMCRVSRALRPGHYRGGWHATATLGRLGAAAACGRLLGLDAAGIDTAVGLAAAQLGGIQESFGSMAKPFQVGRAAADGLLAALAAAEGMSGPTGLLGREGWARRLSPDWHPAALAEGLGDRWALPEVHFKRYPCCFATHAAIRGLLALGPVLAGRGARAEAIDLAVCRTTLQVADQRSPSTGLGGKFSMTYLAAAALLRGRVTEAECSDAAVADGAARELAGRVRLEARADLDETRAEVAVRLPGGEVHTWAADLAQDAEATARELGGKFDQLVAPVLGAAGAGRLREAILHVDDLDDVGSLTRRSAGS